jgi:hypothetical protein
VQNFLCFSAITFELCYGICHQKDTRNSGRTGIEWNTWALFYADDINKRGRMQNFPDWPPGVRTANGTALCHYVQLYRYIVSQSSEFCLHNPLCYFSTSVYCCKRIFRYRLSPETFGYTIIRIEKLNKIMTCYRSYRRSTKDLSKIKVKAKLSLSLIK